MTLDRADFDAAFAAIVPEDAAGLLLAVSGGPDSTALMHAAAGWAGARGRPGLVVATVDHGLREGSRAEAEAVAAAAGALGLPHHILAWTDRAAGQVSQEAAREARYRLLGDLAGRLGIDALVTAHTRDDQAETILMRMAAGSGPAGLAGMSAIGRRGTLAHLRPFLGFAKADLVATCRNERWSFAEDPSNEDPRFARVRWRRVMPALAAEGLDSGRLARLASRLRRWDEALGLAAEAASRRCLARAGAGAVTLDLRALADEPEEVAIRVLAGALNPDGRGAALRLDRLEACLAALRSATAQGRAMRRTLAGRVLSLDRAGCLSVASEGGRMRGRRGAVTVHTAEAPHSLGIDASRA